MSLAVLSIDLEARLAKLEEGLSLAVRVNEKAASDMQSRWERMEKAARSVGQVIGTAFGAVAVQQLFSLTRSSIDALDALNDLADASGASIENLSALEDVARRNGETLELVSGVLVKFNSALKEAKPDNGVGQALKAIGVNAQQLRQLDPAEALRQTAVALAGFADDGNKARIVQELFGKSVKEAAPFLKDLAEQGQLNATVTSDQARQAEVFNKELAALRTNISNAGRSIVSDLLPAMNDLFERSRQNGGLFGGIASALQASFGNSRAKTIGAELKTAVDELERLTGLQNAGKATNFQVARIQELRGEIDSLQRDASAATESVKTLLNGGKPVVSVPSASYSNEGRNSIRSLPALTDPAKKGGGVSEIQRAIDALEQQTLAELNLSKAEEARLKLSLGLYGKVSDAQRDYLLLLAEGVDAMKESADLRGPVIPVEILERRNAVEAELNSILDGLPTSRVEKLKEVQEEIIRLFEEGKLGAQKFREATDALAAANPLLKIDDGAVVKANQKISDFAEQARRNIQDALGDSLYDVLTGNFDDIGRKWKQLIARMAAEALAARLNEKLFGSGGSGGGWIDALFKVVGGWFKGVTGSALGNVFGPSGHVNAYAMGGVMTGPTYFRGGDGSWNLGGEAGYEGILPLKRGRDGKLGVSSDGGGGNTTIYQVAAGVQRNELIAALTQLHRQVSAEMGARFRRNGLN